MGAGVMDYKELSHQAELHTGGLNASTHVSVDPADINGFTQVQCLAESKETDWKLPHNPSHAE